MDKSATPSLLPILRSQQQAEILCLVLGDPEAEFTLTELAKKAGVAYASTHREIERAEKVGLVISRRIGRTRVIRANTESPYFSSLSDLLVRAFGPAMVLGRTLAGVDGVSRAFLFGSWAAGYQGAALDRPVGDLDLLILGTPDRDQTYAALTGVEERFGRDVQTTIRDADWLDQGSGAFHANVTARPLVELDVSSAETQ